tara:strand:- start:31906 stop:32064 length:159 start_codon:yes stop_codon:yes gene_type:complete
MSLGWITRRAETTDERMLGLSLIFTMGGAGKKAPTKFAVDCCLNVQVGASGT